MKRLKKPTRAQKQLLDYYHLKPENWLVKESTSSELIVVHRYTNTERTLDVKYISEFKGKRRA